MPPLRASFSIAAFVVSSAAMSWVVLSCAGCSSPAPRGRGQAWSPSADAAGDDGATWPADDDDGGWPDPTDPAPGPAPELPPPQGDDDTDGGDATTGVPGDTADGGEPGPSPYVGGWDIGACQDDITPGGDIAPDFTLLDANGDQVRLYDFCHKVIFLTDGAFW